MDIGAIEQPRMDMEKLVLPALKPLRELEEILAQRIDRKLLHLLKLRASQINGCAYCLDMHMAEALDAGETPQRLILLDGWAESPLYDERERALLAWTEALTRITDGHAPKQVYETLQEHFSPEEIAYLTVAIAMMNLWNRIAIASRPRHKVRGASNADAASPRANAA